MYDFSPVFGVIVASLFAYRVFLLYGFFSNSIRSPINTIVADMTPPTAKGLSFSVYFFTEGLIASMTPTVAAVVVELSNIWYVFFPSA